jgi:hypothetical protein
MNQSNYEVFANTYYTDPNYEFGNELMKLIEGQSILLPQRIPSGILDVLVDYVFTNIDGGSVKIQATNMGTLYHIEKNV